MWILYAIGSSFFAGITAVFAKCGIQKTDSNVATALRTIVVLLFSWLMVLITGTWTGIADISGRTLLFPGVYFMRNCQRKQLSAWFSSRLERYFWQSYRESAAIQ